MADLYRRLWMAIGHRPWTYITRDSYHNAPLIWIVGLLAAGAFVGRFFGLLEFADFLWKFLIGVMAGHFFWGSRYIRNEKGK